MSSSEFEKRMVRQAQLQTILAELSAEEHPPADETNPAVIEARAAVGRAREMGTGGGFCFPLSDGTPIRSVADAIAHLNKVLRMKCNQLPSTQVAVEKKPCIMICEAALEA